MDDRLSLELIPAAIGNVCAGSVRFLLCASAEKISGGKTLAVRTRDIYRHVPVLVVHDVAYSLSTERVADRLTIHTPGFPRYESPSTNERIGCHGLCLQVRCLRFLPCPVSLQGFSHIRLQVVAGAATTYALIELDASLSDVAADARRPNSAVWLLADPLDEPANVRVSLEGLERVVLAFELLVVENRVYVPVAGRAEVYRAVDLLPVEGLLVPLVLVARPRD
jgi:hypothetical protein